MNLVFYRDLYCGSSLRNLGRRTCKVRCDLHVHTIHSGMSTVPLLRRLCRECYSPPEAVYDTLKRKGMDLVTLTDHDSIEAGEALRRHPDFFLSEEVTCRMPSGTEVHVAVYDITDRQHVEIQRRRNDLNALLAYLREQDIFFGVNHAFSRLTGRRQRSDFDWFETAFPAVETLNGHVLPRNNDLARNLADLRGKAALGGSDAHTLLSAGSVFTSVPGARNRHEFLQGLRRGKGRVSGRSGSYWKLTRDVLLIAWEMMMERPVTLALLPLALAIPGATFLNSILEGRFARRWEHRFDRPSTKQGAIPGLPAHLAPEEVSA
jgi:predicted metal-dependent phosphoesterase TrpH